MTLIVGLKLHEATVVAADREENDSYLRNDVQKIKVYNLGGWTFAFAGAGQSPYIEYAIQKLREKIGNLGLSFDREQLRAALDSEILRIHKQHIFSTKIPDPNKRPEFSLIIQASHLGETLLFETRESLVREIEHIDKTCVGGGEPFATSLLNKYFGGHSLYGGILLAVYTVMQTKRYICQVGGGTDVSVHAKDRALAMRAPLIVPLEEMLDELDQTFEGTFFGSLNVSSGTWERDAEFLETRGADIRQRLAKEMDRLFKAFNA